MNATKIHLTAELLTDMLFTGRLAYGQPDLNIVGASFDEDAGAVVLDIEGDSVPADSPECTLHYRCEHRQAIGGSTLSIALFDGLHSRNNQ